MFSFAEELTAECDTVSNLPCTTRRVLLAAALICVGWWPEGTAAAEGASTAVEALRAEVLAQRERITQLEAEITQQGERLRRLPQTQQTFEEGEAPSPGSRGSDADDSEQSPGDTEPSEELRARLGRLEQALLGIERRQTDFLDSASGESLRVVNGRIHIDRWGFPEDSPGVNVLETGNPADGPVDRLMYRRIRFGVRGTVAPNNMSYRVEIEFSGQDGSQFRDAWIGWDDIAFLGTVRFGNQKRPYGWDHLNSSNYMLFLERPFIVEALNEDNRRLGLVVYNASEDLAFNWQYGVYDLDLVQDAGSTLSNNYPLEFAWRLANTFWYDETSGGRGYGHLGLSGTFAFPCPHAPIGEASESRARFRTRPKDVPAVVGWIPVTSTAAAHIKSWVWNRSSISGAFSSLVS